MKRIILIILMSVFLFGGAPTRVVSQTVGTDELLLALADPEQIAALSHLSRDSRYSPVVEEAKRYPHLKDSDAESVLRFKPDLVLATSFTRAETLILLKRTSVKLLVFDRFENLEDVYANARKLGEALGHTDRAEALIHRCQEKVRALTERLKGVKLVRVLAASISPFTAGAVTTFQDLCDHAGALNVAAEAGLKGHQPTPIEKVLTWNPEVLIASGEEDSDVVKRLGDVLPYKHLSALKAGRVLLLPGPLMSSVSHHRIEAYDRLARALHPERFR